MDLNLRGKIALVTGASRGIGLACARQLAEEGCHLHLASRTKADLERAKEGIQARHNVSVTVHPVDLSNGDAARSLAAACSEVDILVNNAGGAISKPFAKHVVSDFRAMLEVNLLSAVVASQVALPGMRSHGFGRIVNIASTAGLKGYAYVTAYVAAKHALVGFTRALALETVKDGITVNAVCPGFTDTNMLARSVATIVAAGGRSREEARGLLASGNPAGRLVRPEEVAEAVAFLCRPDASAMTGQAIAVACGEV